MKLLRTTTIIFVLVMIVGIIFFVRRINKTEYGKKDVVYYNDQLHNVQADLLLGVSEEEIEKKYNCSIIMSTNPDEPELIKLISKRALVMDIMRDGDIIGKVAWTDIEDDLENQKSSLIRSVIIIWVIIMVGVLGIMLMIYLFMIRPVNEMKEYSEEIARGNLDAPIPIHRNNTFGSFTESFDIMREELKASKEREMQADKAKKEMVAELSHDIKTPVATIQTTCEVMKLKAERKLEKTLKANDRNDSQNDSVRNSGGTDGGARLASAVLAGSAGVINSVTT